MRAPPTFSGDGATRTGRKLTSDRRSAITPSAAPVGTWTQRGEKHANQAEPDGEYFAADVALSASGKSALVGEEPATRYPYEFGGAFSYTRSGATWSQQGPRLRNGEPEERSEKFGRRVALSADGATALIGQAIPPQRGSSSVPARPGQSNRGRSPMAIPKAALRCRATPAPRCWATSFTAGSHCGSAPRAQPTARQSA